MRIDTRASMCCLSTVVATACGGSGSSPLASEDASTDASVPTFSTQLDVAAGAESFMCQLVIFPEGGYVTYQAHDFTPGSHHFLLYTTDLDTIPSGEGDARDCGEAGGAIQSHIRGVFYGAQAPHRTFTFPQGVGLPVAKGQVLLLQVHYLNATSTTLHVSVNAYFRVDTVGTSITTRASNLFWYDPFIAIPAGQRARAQMRCPIQKDVTILYAASHYHRRGVGYAAYLDDAAGQLAAKPFYTSANWEDPEPLTNPFQAAAGSRIRFECDYDNTAGTADFFQGQSALTNEMCVFAATYYPAIDADTDFCRKGGEMFGVGQAGCSDTVACLSQCLANVRDDAGSSGGGGGVTPCDEACVVQSCPAFSDTAIGVTKCIVGSCSTACGLTGADGGAPIDAGSATSDAGSPSSAVANDACRSCLLAACPAAAGACANDTTCPATPGGQ